MIKLNSRPPDSDWRPPPPSEWPDWAPAKRVGIDTETYDPFLKTLGRSVRRGGYVAGFSIALQGGPSLYLPLRHEGGDNVEDPEQALAYLRYQTKRYPRIVVGANIGYDLDYLAEEGIEFPLAEIRDVQIAEPILDEHRRSYALDGLGDSWLGRRKDEALLRAAAKAYCFDPKADLWRLPARYVGPYGEADAELPLAILDLQEREIGAQGLDEVYGLETALIPLFHAMTRLGVRINVDELERLEDEFREKERAACAEVKHQTSVNLLDGVWEPERCASVLAEIGVTCPRTPKNDQPSVTVEFLESIEHPVAALIRRARQMNKARTTFCAQIRERITNGRVHCEWHQLPHEVEGGKRQGAVSGRPSATNPNLLFIPTRDPEIGPLFRRLFIADEGLSWSKLDFSSQEPRIAIDKAHRLELPRAAEVVARYVEDPATDCHQMTADLTGRSRTIAKGIFLGLLNGMGGGKLCEFYLNLPTVWKIYEPTGTRYLAAGPEGQYILDEFNREMPFFKKLAKRAKEQADTDGFITTLLGRRCRFPTDDTGNYAWTWKALNRYIQGSAADQTKQAMLDVWRELHVVPHLQAYDELGVSVEDRPAAQAIADLMEVAVPISVPARVDVTLGTNWGDCE